MLHWTKGHMLTPKWAALALLTQQWPTLIWEMVCMIRITLMLSSKNCIEPFYSCVKVRIMYKSVVMPKLLLYIYWGTGPKYKLQ